MTSNTIISVTAAAFCILALGWLLGGHWSRWFGYALYAVGAASCVLILLMARLVWLDCRARRLRRQIRRLRARCWREE